MTSPGCPQFQTNCCVAANVGRGHQKTHALHKARESHTGGIAVPNPGIICLVCRPRPSTGGVHRAAGAAVRSENEHCVILVTAQPPPTVAS